LDRFGCLMRESHRSLRDLFEVSCRELDVMSKSPNPWTVLRRPNDGGGSAEHGEPGEDAEAKTFARQIAERYQAAVGIKLMCTSVQPPMAQLPLVGGWFFFAPRGPFRAG